MLLIVYTMIGTLRRCVTINTSINQLINNPIIVQSTQIKSHVTDVNQCRVKKTTKYMLFSKITRTMKYLFFSISAKFCGKFGKLTAE